MREVPTDTEEAPIETTDVGETIPAETEPYQGRFENKFAANQACLNALDLIHHIKYYDEAAMAEYREYQREVQQFLSDDTTTQAQIEELYPQLLERASTLQLQQGDTPRVYITTGNQGRLDRTYRSCRMSFVPAAGEEGESLTFLGCEIRVRGNSTASGPKFPYAFKLPYNESLFGMGAGKRWNLMANHHDKTMMRSWIGFHLADRLGAPYTSQTRFVEVFLDGQYQGSYELVEAITDGKERVDIDVDNHEMILEIDANRNDGSHYLVTSRGLRFKVDKPEDIDQETAQWLDEFLLEAEAALNEDGERYAEYFDVPSFAAVYLTLEYTKNLDSNSFSSRYFIKGNKIYAGPVWDFDLSSGNVSPYVNEEGYKIYLNIEGRGDNGGDSTVGLWNVEGWFKGLFEHDSFGAAVRQLYRDNHLTFENVYAENELGKSWIDTLLEKYGTSYRRNYDDTDWDINARYSPYHMEPGMTFDEHVQFLRDWFRDKLAWLDGIYLN